MFVRRGSPQTLQRAEVFSPDSWRPSQEGLHQQQERLHRKQVTRVAFDNYKKVPITFWRKKR